MQANKTNLTVVQMQGTVQNSGFFRTLNNKEILSFGMLPWIVSSL